jgi:iron complex outermembrane receptor protein
VKSQDTGLYSFQPSGEQKADKGKFTYTASLSYKTPWGVMPYYTYAKASALEVSQAGDIAPSLIVNDSWLSDSDLNEAGVKFQLLKGTLVGSLAAYRQNRTQLIQGVGSTTVQGSTGKGLELEVRWLASEHFSLTFAGNNQRTEIKGRAGFSYLPAFAVGVSPVNAFGGTYITFDAGGVFPSLANGYKYSLIPDTVVSLFGTYTSSQHDWGVAGASLGFTAVSKTSGYVPNAVVLPSYATVNLSGFFERGPYTVTANIDNLFDKLYFTPLGDSYSNMAVLPGRGREARITLKRTF